MSPGAADPAVMRPIHYLGALAVVLIWGANFVPMKIAVTEVPPLFLVGIRMTLAAAILVLIAPFPRGKLREVAVLSMTMGTCHYGLLFAGMKGVDVAVTAIILQLGVPFSAVLARLFLGDRFGIKKTIGLLVALSGVAVLAGEPQTASSLPHMMLVVAGAFSWGFANVQVKKFGPIESLSLLAYMSLFAAPQLFLFSFLFESGQWTAIIGAGWHIWASIGFMVVFSSIISYFIWYGLIGRFPVTHIVPFTLLAPVIGGLCGILILDEVATWQKILGGLLTITGVAIIQARMGNDARAAGKTAP